MQSIGMQAMQADSDDEAFDVPSMSQAPILGAGQHDISVDEFLETIGPADASMAISPNEFNALEGDEMPPLGGGGIWPPTLVHETQLPVELLAVLSEFHTLLLGGGEFHSASTANMQSSNHKYPRYLRAILLKGGFPTRASLFAPGALQIAEAACLEIAREKYASSTKYKERKYYTNYMCARLTIPVPVPIRDFPPRSAPRLVASLIPPTAQPPPIVLGADTTSSSSWRAEQPYRPLGRLLEPPPPGGVARQR